MMRSHAPTPPRTAIRRLAAARLISLAGSGAAFSALAYIVFQRSGQSSVWASSVFLAAFGATAVFTPFTGGLGDRFDRQKVLVVSELLAAAGFAVLSFMGTALSLVLMAFVTSALESPIWSVSTAAIPNLIHDDDQLAWANGIVAVGRNVGFLVGPIGGGLIVSVLAPQNTAEQLSIAGYWVFGLNALSFVVSAGLVWSINGRFADADAEASDEHRGVLGGIRFLVRDRVLRTINLAWIILLLGAGASLVAEIELAESFGAGALGYATLSAMWAGGAIIGAVLGGRLLNARREPGGLVLSIVVVALGLGFVALAPVLLVAMGLTLFAGTGEGFGGVAENGIIQRRTPDAVRSRVIAASEAAVFLAFAVSFVFAGPVVEVIGARGAYVIAGVSCLFAAGVLMLIYRELRGEAEGRPGLHEPEPPVKAETGL
jgi:MFS family permease